MVIATKMSLDTCNFNCTYCFQIPKNRVDQHPRDYDLEAVLKAMGEAHKRWSDKEITAHSGEPTALHPDDLEKLLEKAHDLVGKSSIQTNGWRMDEYWDLFEKYDTSLGVSFDGPEECNLLRGFGSRENRLKIARKIEGNIRKAMDKGFDVSLIAIIHRLNGIEHFGKLRDFLADTGLRGRLNPCSITKNISQSPPPYELSNEELINVYDRLFGVCAEHGLEFSPFRDISNALRGERNVVCVFANACDIYGTPSLKGIDKNGNFINCVKTYHSNVIYPRIETNTKIRAQVLKETDCKDCKWFEYCKGGCPNDAIGDDWRRKTRFCPLYKHLFPKIANTLNSLSVGKAEPKGGVGTPKRGDHGDGVEHTDGDIRHLDSDNPPVHGDSPHGDSPHGDGHGDSG